MEPGRLDWLAKLQRSAAKPKRLIAGLISGTSADGIDTAICEITGGGLGIEAERAKCRLKHFHTYPLDTETQAILFQEPSRTTVEDAAKLNAVLGRQFGEAVLKCCAAAEIDPALLDLVGSHGQTLYHHSGAEGDLFATLQLADGDFIAEVTGAPVFCDFRSRDIAANGEGAPLTPYSDAILFGDQIDQGCVVLNIGGIANITVLESEPSRIQGYDTGPGNAPLDRLTRLLTEDAQEFDHEGALARAGRVVDDLLDDLIMNDEFIVRDPPKSTGLEMYGDAFVEGVISSYGRVDNDLLATLTEFVAASIAQAVVRHRDHHQLVLAGGGSQNIFLMERLQHYLPNHRLVRCDELGVPFDAREAMAFALLANDALLGFTTSLPSVSGAVGPRILGKLCLPHNRDVNLDERLE